MLNVHGKLEAVPSQFGKVQQIQTFVKHLEAMTTSHRPKCINTSQLEISKAMPTFHGKLKAMSTRLKFKGINKSKDEHREQCRMFMGNGKQCQQVTSSNISKDPKTSIGSNAKCPWKVGRIVNKSNFRVYQQIPK